MLTYTTVILKEDVLAAPDVLRHDSGVVSSAWLSRGNFRRAVRCSYLVAHPGNILPSPPVPLPS